MMINRRRIASKGSQTAGRSLLRNWDLLPLASLVCLTVAVLASSSSGFGVAAQHAGFDNVGGSNADEDLQVTRTTVRPGSYLFMANCGVASV